MNALQLKTLIVENWLVPMEATHVCFESPWPGRSAWTADLLAVDRKGLLLEIEVKVSISDLRADARKQNKHDILKEALDGQLAIPHPPSRIFYAVPHLLKAEVMPVTRELYPYAGVLVVGPDPYGLVRVARGAKQLHNYLVDPSEQLYLQKASVRTIGRLLGSLCGRAR